MFSKKHLAGKEVYIFDIPEHIPFYNIKRLRLQDIKKGKIVVKHKKKEYSFVDEGVVTDPVFGVQRYADNERSFGLRRLTKPYIELQLICHSQIACHSKGVFSRTCD